MENITDKVQDYIDGLLKGEELAYFESQMQVDEELRNLVSLQREVHEIINRRIDSKEDALRNSLREAQDGVQDTKRPSKVFKVYIPIAVAASLLLFFSLFFFEGNDAALYDLPAMQSEVVRGQEENVSYEAAVKAFNEKSYSEARGILEKLIVQDSVQIQYQYYAALTYLGEENWSASQQYLEPIAEGKSVFASEAKYYLAVSYIKLNNKQQAMDLLNAIPKDEKLGKKVVRLLKTMD